MLRIFSLLLCVSFTFAGDPPKTLEDYIIAGNHAIHNGQPEKAIENYSKVHDQLGLSGASQIRTHYYNLACAYSLVGKTDKALDVLADALTLNAVPVQHLAKDGDLDNIRSHPRFEHMFQAYKIRRAAEAKIFKGDLTKTPESDTLSIEDRMLGLTRFWSTAKYSFAYFDQVPDLNWDAEYKAMVPKVIAARDTLEYYKLLMGMVAKLQDGHTNVNPPKSVDEKLLTDPPLLTRLIDDKVVIIEIQDQALKKQGLKIGDELKTVDGRDVHDYAMEFVNPYLCVSTEQDRQNRLYGTWLLNGEKGTTVSLGMTDSKGKAYTVQAKRSGYTRPDRPAISWELREDGIGYIVINTFANEEPQQKFPQAMADLKDAKGIVIDIRENGGGNSGWWVMEYFSDSYRTSRWSTRSYTAAIHAWGRPHANWGSAGNTHTSKVEDRFTGPVALLTSARSFSAAEDFAMSFKDSGRGKIFGQATGGSTGQPLFIQLPGGGNARFCTKRDTMPDGTPFVGVGVLPDVEVKETIADLKSGTDAVLNKAVKWCLARK